MARKNKKLLSEGQVRQFMKLANLEPLTPGFVYGMTEKKVMNFGDAEASHIKGDKPKRWEPDYGKKREHSPEEVGAATVAQPTTSSEPTEVDMPAKRVPAKPSPSKVDVPRAKQQRNPQAGMKRESHGRGRDEGDGGYGRPDPRQRPAGAALREQDDLDVELDDLEGRCQLVLHNLDTGLVADHLVPVLDRANPANIEADRSIKFKCIAAGRGFRAAEHHADLVTDLVDEDHCRI